MKHGRLLLTGAAAGLLNGLLGAGGGMVVVPMLEKTAGMPARKAHATSIAIILPLSVLSGGLYLLQGHLHFSQALPFLPLGLCGAALGGWLLPRLKALWLHRIFGALVLWAALRLLLQ